MDFCSESDFSSFIHFFEFPVDISFPAADELNDPALTYFSAICGRKFSKNEIFPNFPRAGAFR